MNLTAKDTDVDDRGESALLNAQSETVRELVHELRSARGEIAKLEAEAANRSRTAKGRLMGISGAIEEALEAGEVDLHDLCRSVNHLDALINGAELALRGAQHSEETLVAYKLLQHAADTVWRATKIVELVEYSYTRVPAGDTETNREAGRSS